MIQLCYYTICEILIFSYALKLRYKISSVKLCLGILSDKMRLRFVWSLKNNNFDQFHFLVLLFFIQNEDPGNVFRE